MSFPRGWGLVVIIVLAILLFGAPKLPQMARNLGQSMRIFKSEVKQMKDDDKCKSDASDDSVQAVEGKVVNDDATQNSTGSHSTDSQKPQA